MSTVNLLGVTIDTEKRITYCNDYFLELMGWTFAELEGRRWDEVCVPPAIEDLSGLFTDLFDDVPSARNHENDVLTRTGERRCIRWNNIVLRDADGVTVGVAGIGEDITERKLLERELRATNTRERRQLQSELHDGLGQEIFGIAILARSLATSAQRQGLPIAADLLSLSTIANQAIETCRRLAQGFSPLNEVHGGLVHALKQLTVKPKDWRGPRVQFSGHEETVLRLPAESLEHVYGVAQEALTNAIKHAGARSITVRFDVRPSSVRLFVEDDGIGLPSARASGMGLKIMRHRAALLRAKLKVQRRAGGGTRISLICDHPG
jgi:PAS domain S-box-containing protein